jgi:hypothetical protein
MTTERSQRTVFYYKSNEHFMKYTGIVCILPKGAGRLTRSASLLSCGVNSVPADRSDIRIRIVHTRSSPAGASFHKQSGFCHTHMWGRDHTVICSVYAVGWLDAGSLSTACKEYLKRLPALLLNYGIHMTITQLQQCTRLHISNTDTRRTALSIPPRYPH